jgi:hypothetical protein
VFDVRKAGSSCSQLGPRRGSRLHRQQLRQNLPCYWLVGCRCNLALTAEFRKVHQFTVFTVDTPVQHHPPFTWRTRSPISITGFYHRKGSRTCFAPVWAYIYLNCRPEALFSLSISPASVI